MPGYMRSALESVLERFKDRRPKLALLTSFNFSAGFFERNVLPLLAGFQAEDGVPAPPHYELNQQLQRVRVLVACDHCTQPEPKGAFRYDLMPIGVKNGFFHPKITILAGQFADGSHGAYAMVASGNLTLSGWALNREVVGVVRIDNDQAAEILPFLQWLKQTYDDWAVKSTASNSEEHNPFKILNGIEQFLAEHCNTKAAKTSPQLFIQLPQTPASQKAPAGSAIIDRLLHKPTGRLQNAVVVSPYWSDVGKLVSRLGLGLDSVRLVPSLNNRGEYQFPLDDARDHCEFAAFVDDGDRYTHAKAIRARLTNDKTILCIGSANFTAAAFGANNITGRRNIEAILRYELDDAGMLPDKALKPLDKKQLSKEDDNDTEEGIPQAPPFDVSAAYDWKQKEFICAARIAGTKIGNSLIVEFAGEEVELAGLGEGWREVRRSLDLTKPRRACFVRDPTSRETPAFRVLVTQLHATDEDLGYTRVARLSEVLNTLRNLYPGTRTKDIKKKEHKGRSRNGELDEDIGDVVSYNYFSTFQAFYKLRKHYFKNRDFDPFALDSSLSLYQILRAVDQEPLLDTSKPAAVIFRFLLLSELDVTIDLLAEGRQDEKVKEIKMRLQKRLDAISGEVKQLLQQHSPSFKTFLGDASQMEQASDTFYNWFQQEFRKNLDVKEVQQ